MKNLTKVLVIAAILAPPVFAENTHQHGDDKRGSAMGMHSEHMQEMQSLMARIEAEQYPEKRQQLMQEHMEVMQMGMQQMSEGMNQDQKMASMNMENCKGMMEKHMSMMQMMMEQMKKHQAEEKKLQQHFDKKH